jgi:hypothetical protein
MENNQKDRYAAARQLMDDFLNRTGITGETGDADRRYLWTDAFAVQTCFALARSENNKNYLHLGLKLIDRVHHTLGKHRPDDTRTGWISGLSEEEGKEHPTAGGLRIGKRLPENAGGSSSDPYREMECDGQYLHYLTRWFNALTGAFQETGEEKYALWAAGLIKATESFIYTEGDSVRLFWKMKTDLSQPSVRSMGLHDPLEALICVYSIKDFAEKHKISLEGLEADLKRICHDMSWFTADALGIGGLLLNVVKAGTMVRRGQQLPDSIRPGKLMTDSLSGLHAYRGDTDSPEHTAESRLPFRECGLSLGIHAALGLKNDLVLPELNIRSLESFSGLAKSLENFWLQARNQEARTWQDHLDINAVTLAASLLAYDHPRSFCPESVS